MIVNYLASRKTRAPFCGLRCCGRSFGVHTPLRMRRYAKRADRLLVKREIQNQLIEDWFWFVDDIDDAHQDYTLDIYNESLDYENWDIGWGVDYRRNYEEIDSTDIDEALDREHWIREGELRDEYYSDFEE